MTAYLASNSNIGQLWVSVTPGSSEIRIARIDMSIAVSSPSPGDPGTGGVTVYYAPSAVTSGGSAATIVKLRGNSVASTATARTNTSTTGSPSGLIVLSSYSAQGAGTFTFDPGLDLILSPGTSVYVFGLGNAGIGIGIYFEELRLSWPA